MKKAITTIFFALAIITTYAQTEGPRLNQRPQVIKKVLIPTPLPANLTQGKDLAISIKTFQFDPANGCSISLNYIVKNNGTEPLDINNIAVQGLIDGPVSLPTATMPDVPWNGKNYYAGGGHSLATTSTILSPGQELEGTLRCFNLGRNNYFNNTNSYTYFLLIDRSNKIIEANETNNTATYTFKGYQGQYQPSVPAAQYYLTDAYMVIKTGADNKEKESAVNIRVIPSNSKNVAANDHNEFIKKIPKNEMPFLSNYSQTLSLGLYMSSTARTVNPATSLSAINQNGLSLLIEYKPNLIVDAWKIEQVELVLTFKDANGIYHPTAGTKRITFNMPANTFLDGFFKHFLVCKTDLALNPVSIKVIEKITDF